jgi:hypothetical protein
MISSRSLAGAILAIGGALGAGLANAQAPQVQWSITIGSPIYGRPLPVYVEPRPIYVQPAPVYVRPAPVWVPAAPVLPRQRYVQANRWDRDGDGIPNRYDRVYNPRWDRDGDGVPNWRDRHGNRDAVRHSARVPGRYEQQVSQEWRGR